MSEVQHIQANDKPSVLTTNAIYFIKNGSIWLKFNDGTEVEFQGLKQSYPQANIPLSDTDKIIVRQGTEWKEADKSDFDGNTENKIYFEWNESGTKLIKNAWTRVELNTKYIDDENLFDGKYFIVKNKGIYKVGGGFTITKLEDGKKMVVSVYKNSQLFFLLARGISGGNDIVGFSGSFLANLEIGDKLEVRIYHNNSVDTNLYVNQPWYNYFYANLIEEL